MTEYMEIALAPDASGQDRENAFIEEMNERWLAHRSIPKYIVADRRTLLAIMNWSCVVTKYALDATYGVESHFIILPYAKIALREKDAAS